MSARKLVVTLAEIATLSSEGASTFCIRQAAMRGSWGLGKKKGQLVLPFSKIPDAHRVKWGLPSDELAAEVLQRHRDAAAEQAQEAQRRQLQPTREEEALYRQWQRAMLDRAPHC